MTVKLIKNGCQNDYEKTDFKDFRPGKDYRSPVREMPAPNTRNTMTKDALKPTRTGGNR